jgi:hypothetical protein
MGMLWNSKATLEMMARINLEFSGDTSITAAQSPNGISPPIKYWRKLREQFNSTTRKELKDLAKENKLFGGGSEASSENANWQTWLTKLGDSGKASAHEDLRAAIYEGLNENKYEEIVFSVLPIAKNNKVKIKTPKPAEHDAATFIIIVETPTYDSVVLSIKARKAARLKKKAAAKKK